MIPSLYLDALHVLCLFIFVLSSFLGSFGDVYNFHHRAFAQYCFGLVLWYFFNFVVIIK